MSTYNITLNENRTATYDVPCWGTEYENKATILNFTFPETINGHEISSFEKYIEFKENTNSKAEEDKAIFYDVLNSNEYAIGSAVTYYNSMNVQVVLKKTIDEATGEMLVWKSKIFTMNFCDGINASDIIDPEDPRVELLDTLVNKVNDANNIVNVLNETISTSEITRQESETTRQENEIARQNNEATRQANETIRQTNEDARNVFEVYNNTKLYVVHNKVVYKGSSYVCIQNTTAGTLPTDTNYWLMIAQKGADGEGGGESGGGSSYDDTELRNLIDQKANASDVETQIADALQEAKDYTDNMDLSTYATTEYVDNAVTGFATTEDITTAIGNVEMKLDQYATSEYVDTEVQNAISTSTLNTQAILDLRISYGTTDLEDGVSELATGCVYLVHDIEE